MIKHVFRIFLLALGLLGTGLVHADPAAPTGPEEKYFRYYDDKHIPHVDQHITEEHLQYGYQVLDGHFQVMRSVAARATGKELERLKAEQEKKAEEAQRQRDDQQLRRLYSSSADAERARDSRLDAIQLRVDFSNNSLVRLRSLRAQEAERAAAFERSGKPVPKDVQDSINRYGTQIEAVLGEIKAHKAEQDAARAEFAPIIQRMQELDAQKHGDPTPPPPAASNP